jgi:hypothetical protein
LAERELASAENIQAKSRAGYHVMELVDLWLTPPDGRLKNLCRRYSELQPISRDEEY